MLVLVVLSVGGRAKYYVSMHHASFLIIQKRKKNSWCQWALAQMAHHPPVNNGIEGKVVGSRPMGA